MKYLILFLLMASCSKVETEEYVTCQVYSTKIEFTNKGEPDILYWYIYEKGNRDYYYATTTDLKRDLSSLTWYRINSFPDAIYKSGQRLNDVTVLKIIIEK